MTNRINGLTITLSQDIREDDLEPLINALYMIKGIIKVEQHIVDSNSYFILQRYNWKMRDKILDLFNQIDKENI